MKEMKIEEVFEALAGAVAITAVGKYHKKEIRKITNEKMKQVKKDHPEMSNKDLKQLKNETKKMTNNLMNQDGSHVLSAMYELVKSALACDVIGTGEQSFDKSEVKDQEK